ncbi:iron-sulfur cluster biosynthesis family protein [Alteribacter natronophilus]|uniref:iron-sulfur cluster biosynthesis family protein n=1 Tax=Alteribacter natronophilus TaxID=2583810 RepID=UPI00110D6CAF|nr:iron-sulfur cluster biosynthesis family protein [Alteribacter natronophilus]TMW73378.1 hypothetical protein FGB90_03475 [Alteribacter natronophilus]
MKLNVTREAADLYKKEMNLREEDSLRLFVRVGGVGSGGFSAGVTRDIPGGPCHSVEVSGITFYVTGDDLWYFDGMTVDYDEDLDEVTFTNPVIGDVSNPEAK